MVSSDNLQTIKQEVRDINLDLIMSSHNVDININRRWDSMFRFLMPNRKLIKYVTKMGGVLTGSRAIRCYSINGKQILERPTFDWDFIITREMAFRICDHFKFKYNLVDNVISVKNCRWHAHPAYSESYRVGPVDVQLIIKPELPDYKEINGIRISNLSYTINEKIKMVDDLNEYMKPPGFPPRPPGSRIVIPNIGGMREAEKEIEKHISDLEQIVIKFNSI